jgi:hypothetical protein
MPRTEFPFQKSVCISLDCSYRSLKLNYSPLPLRPIRFDSKVPTLASGAVVAVP